MFRIKTDIRQYKCETKDKVEKLIRNWVIRPSDLIYNRDEREWLPIGEHPSFVNLFGLLAETEKNTPDTVVTARSPYADRPPVDDDDPHEGTPDGAGPGNIISEAEAGEAPQEVTHVVRRPSIERDSEADEIDPADDVDESQKAPQAVGANHSPERETDEVDAQSRAAIDAVQDASEAELEDETSDAEDVAVEPDDVSEAEGQDAEPEDAEPEDEEPEDEEPEEEDAGKAEDKEHGEETEQAEDKDEAREDARQTDVFEQEDIAESLASQPAPPAAPEGVEPPSSNDEVTMMTEKTLEMLKVTDEDLATDGGEAAEDEPTGIREREPAEEKPDGEDEEGETTNVVPSPLEEKEDEAEPLPNVDGEDDADDADDADEADEPDEADEADEAAAEVPKQKEKSKGPKLGRHDLPEELFATNEISSPELHETMKTLDELGELSETSTPEEAKDDGATPRWGARLEEDSAVEEAWDVIASDLGPDSDVEALRSTDEIDREDSEVEVEIEIEIEEEWDEDEWEEEWEGDTPEPVVEERSFVSEGYKMPLPFPMRPTPEDVRKGLKLTRVGRSRREKAFPLPEPKKHYEVQRRRFDLTPKPPRDQTVLLIVGIVFFIGVIAVLVSSC